MKPNVLVVLSALMLAACGGAAPEPAAPAEEPPPPKPTGPKPGHGVDTEVSMPETVQVEEKPKEEADPPKAAAVEPEFTDGMSVDDARKAVPQGGERLNIDQETLGAPLQNPDFWKPCNVGAQKLTVRIAVWNGKAVGVDVLTKNKKLAQCVDKQVRALEWKDKVRSLNTVDYSF